MGQTVQVDSGVRSQTERWFVSRGIPHVIDGYSATEDVFTRSAPFLGAVFFIEVFASFDDRFDGWAQLAAFVGGAAILVAATMLVNRLRGRAPLQAPDEVGGLELVLFVFAPALLPLLFSNDRVLGPLTVVIVNLLILGLTYFVTSFGLFPIIRFGAVQMARRVGQMGQLMARSLPLLLLFTTFIFLNAEMWQVASDFVPLFYVVVVTGILAAGVAFMVMRAPAEVADLEHFDDWQQVMRLAGRTDAPIATARPRDEATPPEVQPLGRGDRTNVTLLVVVSQLVQVLLVALLIGLFYVGFGLLAVREATIEQWTTTPSEPLATIEVSGSAIVVTWEHLAVAGFIAAFSALQFSVSMVTDKTYRDQFYEDVTGEVRQVLAVRALYLDALSGEG